MSDIVIDDLTDIRRRITAEFPCLRRYARKLFFQPDRSDDLFQETIARALANLHLFEPTSNLRSWLFKIMSNLHIDARRSASRDLALQMRYKPLYESVMGPGQDAPLFVRDMQRAIAKLSSEQQQLIHLVCIEEMEYHEVAEVLKMPIGTVQSRLHRARLNLRLAFKDGAGA